MKYLDFIEDYGTHFNIRAEFGGWRGQLSVFTKEDYQQLKSGIIPIKTKAEISRKEIFTIVLFYQTFWPDANFSFSVLRSFMEDDKAKEYLMYSDDKSRKELHIYGFDHINCQ